MDRHLWYYRFKADVSWLENFIEDIERTDRALITSLAEQMGVVVGGFLVTERAAGQNFSVDISAGQGYDNAGKRFYNSDTQNLPFVEDELGDPIEVTTVGNERIVSIYAAYALVDEPSSSVVDGFGDTQFTIQTESVSFELYQGTEAASGTATPPAGPGGDQIPLANVLIKYADLTIADADIDEDVKQYLTFVLAPDTVTEDEIDWGLSSGQVSAEDVPIRDTPGDFIATNVEDALIELYDIIGSTDSDLAAHIADTSTHGVSGDIVGTTDTQTLSNKTLTTPTIASFANANHTHQNSAGGGVLDIVNATTGTLSVARGGTGTTTSTGTGSVVLSSSPTIVTPTIASFANANHNHENSAGGGTLSAAAIASGTLPVARGGTGTTTSTGTGSVVLSSSPTITSPSLSDVVMSGTWTGNCAFSGNLNFDSGTFYVDATNDRTYWNGTSFDSSGEYSSAFRQLVSSTASGPSSGKAFDSRISTYAFSVGVTEENYHNSASPAVSDSIYWAYYTGNNASGTRKKYSEYIVGIRDTTAGAEDGAVYIRTIRSGTSTNNVILYPDSVEVNNNLHFSTDDTYDIGEASSAPTDIYSVNPLTVTSDHRKKEHIIESDLGLDFIMSLQPKKFKWKNSLKSKSSFNIVKDRDGKDIKIKKIKKIKKEDHEKRFHYGLIAQDVEEALKGKDFAGFCYDKDSDKYMLRYQEFMAPMIKAIQELSLEIKKLKEKKS